MFGKLLGDKMFMFQLEQDAKKHREEARKRENERGVYLTEGWSNELVSAFLKRFHGPSSVTTLPEATFEIVIDGVFANGMYDAEKKLLLGRVNNDWWGPATGSGWFLAAKLEVTVAELSAIDPLGEYSTSLYCNPDYHYAPQIEEKKRSGYREGYGDAPGFEYRTLFGNAHLYQEEQVYRGEKALVPYLDIEIQLTPAEWARLEQGMLFAKLSEYAPIIALRIASAHKDPEPENFYDMQLSSSGMFVQAVFFNQLLAFDEYSLRGNPSVDLGDLATRMLEASKQAVKR